MVTLIFLYRTHAARSIPCQLAQSAMDSVMRHLWSLAPDTVVFCLFDPETSDVEKREEARAIVCTPHPATIQLGKPYMACADAR